MMQDRKPDRGPDFDTSPDEWMSSPDTSSDNGFESGVPDGEEENDHDPAIMAMQEEAGLETTRKSYWPASDQDSPCYRHLLDNGVSPASKDFNFNGAAFELLCAANRYAFKGKNDVVVFGMRGAMLVEKEFYENVQALPLETARPDLRSFRCVIGYYFRSTGTFSAYTASTVPWHGYIAQGKKANVLPPGCYVYVRGPHPRSAAVNPAFRLPDKSPVVTVLRRSSGNVFDFRGTWDTQGDVWDNIHCAYYEDQFSSQGCQTIKGGSNSPGRNNGLWGRFQSVIRSLGDPFVDYVLMTGDEASLAATLADAGRTTADAEVHRRLARLRVGSEGEEVRRLTELLKLKSGNYFGPRTKRSLIELQLQKGLPADGILSPAIEALLGGGIFDASGQVIVPGHEPRPTDGGQAVQPQGGGQPAAPGHGDGGTPAMAAGEGGQTQTAGTGGGKRTEATAMLTREFMARIAPPPKKASQQPIWEAYVDALTSDRGAEIFARHKVADTRQRMAYILGNMCAETGGLTLLRESMVWKTPSLLADLARGDEATAADLIRRQDWVGIGDWLYGITAPRQHICRGLGNREPKDGFRYRGGGLLQTTGRAAYRKIGERCGFGTKLEDNPDLIDDPYVSLQLACAEWEKLNKVADEGDYLGCCKGINLGNPNHKGTPKGMPHRNHYVREACKAYGIGIPASARVGKPASGFESTRGGTDYEYGDIDPAIADVQRRLDELGYDAGRANGVFSEQTRDALLSFQATNGLPTNGLIDDATRQALAMPEAVEHWSRRGHGQGEDDETDPAVSTRQDASPHPVRPVVPPEMMVSGQDIAGARYLETYRGTHLFTLADGRIYLAGSVAVATVEIARATIDLLAGP